MATKKIEPKNPETTTTKSTGEDRTTDRKTQAFRANGRKSARTTSAFRAHVGGCRVRGDIYREEERGI